MYELYDRVKHLPTGKPCFIIDIDEPDDCPPIYGLEAEDQADDDWFYWAKTDELMKLPEKK